MSMSLVAAGTSHSPEAVVSMVVAALLLGIVIGVVPVVAFRLAAQGRARPAPRRRAVRPEPKIFEPVAPEPVAAAPVARAALPAPAPEPATAPPVEVVSDRHRDLYDEEYSKQLDRVERLRRTIRTRLSVGAAAEADT